MKKYLVVLGLFLIPMIVRADGNYTPALVTSTVTNQGYLYPATGATNAPAVGAFLVGNGSVFNWSNTTIGTTNTATTQQFPTLPSATLAQLQALTPATTAQIVFCNNCIQSQVCISTGIGISSWVNVSSNVATAQPCK